MPIIIPIFFLWTCNFPTGKENSVSKIFIELLQNGFFIFTSSLLFVSIFQDAKIVKLAIDGFDYLLLFFFLFSVGIIYMSDNPINRISDKFNFKDEFETVKFVFLFGIMVGTYVKLKVLWRQQFNVGFIEHSIEFVKKLKRKHV
jgi:hypothetical protein